VVTVEKPEFSSVFNGSILLVNMKKIYLIRHGETDYNLKGIVQGGRVDTSLNNTGLRQAVLFFEKYKDVPFDRVYTSALKRSVESVQNFIDLGIPHEAHSGLNEISWGDKDGKIVTAEDTEFYWKMLEAWSQGDIEAKIEGGESPSEVQRRLLPVLDLILSRKEEKNILVCMHGRAIRILLATILNYHLKCMDQFQHHNLGLYVLTHTGTMFSVDIYNNIEHLG
jgi:broad specificity phosphatase PhoE